MNTLVVACGLPPMWVMVLLRCGNAELDLPSPRARTPESVGDYASGTNHVLPTYGYARMYSGVSLDSFQKKMTVQARFAK